MKNITKLLFLAVLALLLFNFQCGEYFRKNYLRHLRETAEKQLIATWETDYNIDTCKWLRISFNEDYSGEITFLTEDKKTLTRFSCPIKWEVSITYYSSLDYSEYKPLLTIYRLSEQCAGCDKGDGALAPDTTDYVIFKINEKSMTLYLKSQSSNYLTENDIFNSEFNWYLPSKKILIKVE